MFTVEDIKLKHTVIVKISLDKNLFHRHYAESQRTPQIFGNDGCNLAISIHNNDTNQKRRTKS